MPIIISEEEKAAIQDYFDNPGRYISEEVLASLPGGILPAGTKVSRAKRCQEDGRLLPRHYTMPAGVDGDARHITITTPFLDDPGVHSATMMHGKIYFHQNKDDLPKKLPDNFAAHCEIDEDPEDEAIVAYRAYWERALAKPDYVLNVIEFGLFKKTVKYAVDIEGELFYLKSQSSFVEGGVSLSNHAEQYAPQLYMGPSIFKRRLFYQNAQIKRIDITRNVGKNLEEFMLIHGDELTLIDIEALAREILKQYLVELNAKRMVHTDIKATNICVKITHDAGSRFGVVFIDWDEAFSIESPSTMGRGTAGYMAPEFFKTLQDCERQLENRGIGMAAFCDTLKSDYKNFFSQASDIYALGIVLLDDLQLEPSSSLYELAHAMCHNVPNMRPSAEYIQEALEPSAHSGVMLEKMS